MRNRNRSSLTPALLSTLAAIAIAATACTVAPRSATTSARGDATTTTLLDPSSEPVAAVVERVLPAVVNVTTDTFRPDQFGNIQEGQGIGTGFIVRSDGIVVTNCHVVEDASQISVFTSAEEPARFDARVIGGDCLHDLAVLKIDATGLPTVPLGDSASLRLGQRVVAIGYALGLEGGPSVTAGIVSSMDRVVRAHDPSCDVCGPDRVRVYSDVIQTDAAINHGNSGGPLVDMRGRVVGINSAGSDAAENIGFAIAIDAAVDTIDSAMRDPLAAQAYLGVSTQDVTSEVAFQLSLPVESGAYVLATTTDGPAATASVREGDIIASIAGEPITDAAGVGAALEHLEAGQEVAIEVVRPDGTSETLEVTLGTRPLPTELP